MGQSNNKYGAWPINDNAPITWLPIKTTQTLTKGDFVILSSGQVAIALANSAELCGVIAQDCASLTAGTLVPVYADPETDFEVICDAISSGTTPGAAHDIVGSTGAMMLDVGASTYDVLTIKKFNPEDSTAAAYARCTVRITKHAYADISS
jgi:hypothetical protein